MPSGGGTSIQSTWPERSAARRVLASGIGSSRITVDLGLAGCVPVAVVAGELTDWRGTTLVMLERSGAGGRQHATRPQSRPAFSNEAGDVNRM